MCSSTILHYDLSNYILTNYHCLGFYITQKVKSKQMIRSSGNYVVLSLWFRTPLNITADNQSHCFLLLCHKKYTKTFPSPEKQNPDLVHMSPLICRPKPTECKSWLSIQLNFSFDHPTYWSCQLGLTRIRNPAILQVLQPLALEREVFISQLRTA